MDMPHLISTLLYGFNERGEVLLLRRGQEPNLGLWSPPGGKLETSTGESPYECACREAAEEMGLSLGPEDLHLTGVVSERGEAGTAHWLMFLFEIKPRLTRCPDPISEGVFGFFSASELEQLSMPETDRERIWPLFWEHRGGFFAVHCRMEPGGQRIWTIEESGRDPGTWIVDRTANRERRTGNVERVTPETGTRAVASIDLGIASRNDSAHARSTTERGEGANPSEPIIDLQSDLYFMGEALRQARRAFAAGEVPVGAVVVRAGRVIARAHNQVELLKDATAHAEMLAITQAEEVVGDWRLTDCTLYVTKEPCPMCAGAAVHVRLARIVYGVADAKGGAAGGAMNVAQCRTLNHRCEVAGGVREFECRSLLKEFFTELRNADGEGGGRPN
jgi:tRNA(Arg) A34 adenosine deaminase TadA/ADP-ribose pyrophosphatase YjhB (NUDIX family)